MGRPIPPLLLSSPSLGTHADIPELDMAHACNSTDGVPKQKTLNVKANRGCMTKFCIKKFEEIHLKKTEKIQYVCFYIFLSISIVTYTHDILMCIKYTHSDMKAGDSCCIEQDDVIETILNSTGE